MGRNLGARAIIIALLWAASFAVVPADWGTWVSATLRVLPFLDPTAGVIGIAAGALIKGLAEFNALVRLPSEVEIHRLYSTQPCWFS